MVDYLTSFNEDTVEPFLSLLKPDIYAKRPGRSIREELPFGGQVVVVKEGTDHTADKLIQEILRKYGPLPTKP
jgi:bifunctional ADP-heptose synthase (sugar kinase/adenylyltransferase)